MDLFGRLANLCLDFDHLVSHRNPPVQCAPDKVLEPVSCLPTKSRALRDSVVSVAPKQARGGEHLRICLTCATGFGLGIGLPRSAQSGPKSGDHFSTDATICESASLHPREAVGMEHCQALPTRDKQMPSTMMCAQSSLPSPRLRDGLSDTHSGDPFSKPDMRAAILPLCCKFNWRLKGCH